MHKSSTDHDSRYYTEPEIDEKFNKLNSDLENIILNKLYPVGSIYLETTNTNPSSKLGGTWVAYGSSDTYLRLGGSGSGGSNSFTLSTSNLPSHTHGLNGHTHSIPALSGSTNSSGSHNHNVTWSLWVQKYGYGNINPGATEGANKADIVGGILSDSGSHTHSITTDASTTGSNSNNTSSTGGGIPVNINPKYVQVYAWKRTA